MLSRRVLSQIQSRITLWEAHYCLTRFNNVSIKTHTHFHKAKNVIKDCYLKHLSMIQGLVSSAFSTAERMTMKISIRCDRQITYENSC